MREKKEGGIQCQGSGKRNSHITEGGEERSFAIRDLITRPTMNKKYPRTVNEMRGHGAQGGEGRGVWGMVTTKKRRNLSKNAEMNSRKRTYMIKYLITCDNSLNTKSGKECIGVKGRMMKGNAQTAMTNHISE